MLWATADEDEVSASPSQSCSMKTVVGSHNPISVAFEVMERGRGGGGYSRLVAQVVPDLRHYSSGVYSSTTCVGTPDKVREGREEEEERRSRLRFPGAGWGLDCCQRRGGQGEVAGSKAD
eukprot:756522-Hanusia_phi.AAC.2